MDIDDELLGLAEGASKRKSKKSTKRKRPAESEDSASDMDMSASDSDGAGPPPAVKAKKSGRSAATADSDADDDDDANDARYDDPADLYPLEGVYKNEADRRQIMALPEFEREDIIATRKEEMHERETRAQVAKMASRSGGGGGTANNAESDDEVDRRRSGASATARGRAATAQYDDEEEDDDDDEEYGSRGTRSRKATGATSTKSEGLEKLKRSRAEKGKKKDKKNRGSDSDDDYEEGGKSSRRRPSYDSDSDADASASEDEGVKSKAKKKDAPKIGPADLSAVVVTRVKLAEFTKAPWFESWVKGAWVRLGVGMDSQTRELTYRLCQVEGLRTGLVRPYRVDQSVSTMTDIELKLRHGALEKHFTMESISNSPFTDREFNRLVLDLNADKLDMPSPKEIAKIKANLDEHKEYIMTEQDLAAQLAKNGRRPMGAAAKARLLVERDHAFSSGDMETYDKKVAELAELESGTPSKENEQERMRRVNERNRASNREEIQKAEARSQEERRRQAALLAKGESVRVDPSARVKTMTRLTYDSRGGTPNAGTPTGALTPTKTSGSTPALSAAAARTQGNKIESVVASTVQLDVDLDF